MFFFPSYPSHIELAWANLISLLLDTYFCPPICPCDDIRWNWYNFLQQIFILFVYFTILKGEKKIRNRGEMGGRNILYNIHDWIRELHYDSVWVTISSYPIMFYAGQKATVWNVNPEKKKGIFCFVFILIVFLYFPLSSVYLEVLF